MFNVLGRDFRDTLKKTATVTMSSRIIVAILMAVVCASEARYVNDRSLLASLSTRSSAVSTAKDGKAEVETSAKAVKGDVVLEAEAIAESLEKVKNEILDIKVKVEKEVEGGEPVRAAAEVAAKAIGKAIAKTLTTVFITGESTGEGNELCASAASNAEAKADAAAKVFVEVFTKAENDEEIADASGVAEAIATATAKAASDASASACLKDEGAVLAFQESFANAVSTAYATVIVDAFGEIDEGGAKASVVNRASSGVEENVEVGAESENEVEGQGTSESTANADASGDKLPDCENFDSMRRCCRKGKPNERSSRKICRCGLSCSMSYERITPASEADIFVFTLLKPINEFEKGHKCRCIF